MGDRRRTATALRFRPGSDDAPEVVASGSGHQADKVLALAEAHGIPVKEDPLLAEALAQLAAGTEIPPDLYVAVAEALLWAWKVDRGDTAP